MIVNTRILFASALCAFIQLATATLRAAESEPVLATVNNQPITASEVIEGIPVSDRSSPDARKAALERLIDRALILQYVKEKAYTIPKDFIRERTNEIVKQEFGGDQAKFEATLTKQGYTLERFEKKQEEDIFVQEVRRQIAKSATDAAKKEAVENWLAASRAKASIIYK
jgi:hypothetical protein